MTRSFVLDAAVSVFSVLDVLTYAPEAEWEWKSLPVKFPSSQGAGTSVRLLLGSVHGRAACCGHLASPRDVPVGSEGLGLLIEVKQRCWKENTRRICTDLGEKLHDLELLLLCALSPTSPSPTPRTELGCTVLHRQQETGLCVFFE